MSTLLYNFHQMALLKLPGEISTYTDRYLMVENTIFYGKPEPLGISGSYS